MRRPMVSGVQEFSERRIDDEASDGFRCAEIFQEVYR